MRKVDAKSNIQIIFFEANISIAFHFYLHSKKENKLVLNILTFTNISKRLKKINISVY